MINNNNLIISKNKDNLYNELLTIIEQQSILSQKVGILLAINSIFITAIFSFSFKINLWLLFILITPIISLFLNLYILFPKFKSRNNSKYFYDYANLSEDQIEKEIENYKNTLKQIKINSIILKNKYNLYKHSLAINFLFIPYLFLIIDILKNLDKK